MKSRLEELESLANKTGNPVFAWEAISVCNHQDQIPPWVFSYLKCCAAQLLSLDPAPKTLPGAVLDAFGLAGPSGPGKLVRAKAAARKIEVVRYMGEKVCAVGVDKAASLAAKEYGLAPGTVRTYFYESKRAKS